MEASPKFQLNNTVAVKVSLNDDLRRFTFDGDYSALCREIGSMFQLGPLASFTLKYKDDEDDLITLCNDRDLAEAKRVCSSALRLNVLLSSAPTATTSETAIVEAKPADKKEAKAAAKAEKKEEKKSLKEAKDVKKKEHKHNEKPTKEPKKALEEPKKEHKHHEKPAKEPKKPEEKELSKEERQKRKEQKRVLKEAKEAAKEQKRQEKDQKKASKEAKKSDHKDDAAKPPKAKLEARFVKDITLEDGTEVQPGASLVKTWRFRNEGNKTWPAGSKLIFVSKLKGDIMGAPEEVLAPIAEPGAEVDVSVPMVAPTAPGRYVGFWRLCTPEGKKFGQRVRVLVYVPSASSSSDSSTAEEEAPKKKKETKQKHRKEAAATEVTPELQDKVVQLEKLGFTNKKRNLKLLQKFGGDLSAVVNKLVLRQQKEKKLRETPKKKNDDM